MAHLIREDGTTVLKLANVTDVEDDAVKYVTFTEDVYEAFSFKGASGWETGKKLKFAQGQTIRENDLTGYFTTATVTAISPTSGTTAGGTAVTLTGTHLAGTSVVTFGGTNATSVVVVDDSHITCVTPAKSAGAVTVVVQAPSGNVSKAAFYTYA
jgi:hypothetical protein